MNLSLVYTPEEMAMPSEWSIRTRERLAHVEVFPLDVLRILPAAEEFDSGVYFLWAEEALIYVGKSRNLCGREYYQKTVNRYYPFQQSTTAKYIPADLMTCLIVHSGVECPPRLDGRLQELERAYIAAYEPAYNVDYRNGFT